MPGAVETHAAASISPLAGRPAPREMLVDLARLEREYFERRPDLDDPQPDGHVRNQRTPRLLASGHLHRGPHPGDHPGNLRLPRCSRHGWSALHGQGYACAFRAGAANGARGPGGQWRGDHHSARRRRDSDAGHFARNPGLQSRPQRALRRRHRDYAFAQPSGGWRLQVQPDERRSGRYRRDAMDRGSGERAAPKRQCRREADAVSQPL